MNIIRSLLGNKGDQGGQAKPVIESSPTPPPMPQPQPLPFPMPSSSQVILENMLSEIDRLTSIERAIIVVKLLGSDEPLKNIGPEDWVKLIEERVGKPYADAFNRWLRVKYGDSR